MCHVAAAAQLSGWRLACSAMDPSGWWRTAEGRLLLAVVSSPSRQPCCTPHSDGRRLRPPDDERLEVAPRCARHVRGAVKLLLGDRALVNLRDVRVPAPSRLDVLLARNAEDLLEIGGARDAI